MMRYPLARQGIYRSFQGEGALLGLPMVFIRLAGCSVGCPRCDTDYRVHRRATVAEIRAEVDAIATPGRWVWITGGEPTDHDLDPLFDALCSYRMALATSGVRRVPGYWDFLSVSPHDPNRWEQRTGDQVNLVPGLNGFSLEAFGDCEGFDHRYATPLYGDPESLEACRAWVETHRGWRLGIQAHRHWGME